MARRKISPLQIWKARYAYVAETIRALKLATKFHPTSDAIAAHPKLNPTGQFPSNVDPYAWVNELHKHESRLQRTHRILAFMQDEARRLLAVRPEYAAAAKALWGKQQESWEAAKHNQRLGEPTEHGYEPKAG